MCLWLCTDTCAVFLHLLQWARHHRPSSMQVGLRTPIPDPPSWRTLACCLCFVWCVALFTVMWPFNCHCRNALTQLGCNGCIVVNLKGNANYFKDSQTFLSLTVNGNSCTQFLVNVRNHGVWTLWILISISSTVMRTPRPTTLMLPQSFRWLWLFSKSCVVFLFLLQRRHPYWRISDSTR